MSVCEVRNSNSVHTTFYGNVHAQGRTILNLIWLDPYFRTDIDRLIDQILLEEPLISESRKPHLKKLIELLIEEQQKNQAQKFTLFKVLRAHLLPLTNCAFNKSGDKFITGSYDRTCKVWDTNSGEELLSLDEHTNVVYTMAFNNPYG